MSEESSSLSEAEAAVIVNTLADSSKAMNRASEMCQLFRLAGLGGCTVSLMHAFPTNRPLQRECIQCLLYLTSQDDDHLLSEDASEGTSSEIGTDDDLSAVEQRTCRGSGLRECAVMMNVSKGAPTVARAVIAAARTLSEDIEALLRCTRVVANLANNSSEDRASTLMRLGAGTLLLEQMHRTDHAGLVEASVMAVAMLATNSKSRTLALIELGLIDLFVSHIKTFGAATPAAYSNRTLLKYVCFGITFVVTDARMYAQTRIKSSGLSDILQSLTDRLTAVQESGTLEGLSDDEVLDLEEVVELIDAAESAIEIIEEGGDDDDDERDSSVCAIS